MAAKTDTIANPIIVQTVEEAAEEFARHLRELLCTTADEFLRDLDAGRWDDVIDDPDYRDVLYLAPSPTLSARSVHAAIQDDLDPLTRVVSCISATPIVHVAEGTPHTGRMSFPNNSTVPLRGRHGISLKAFHAYETIQGATGWSTRTRPLLFATCMLVTGASSSRSIGTPSAAGTPSRTPTSGRSTTRSRWARSTSRQGGSPLKP